MPNMQNPNDLNVFLFYCIVAIFGFSFLNGCYSRKQTKKMLYDSYLLGWGHGYKAGHRKDPCDKALNFK